LKTTLQIITRKNYKKYYHTKFGIQNLVVLIRGQVSILFIELYLNYI